jgi:hypothetical protein
MRIRNKEIRQRRTRRAKLKKLKTLLAETKDIKTREEIIEKIRKYEYRFNPE